MPRQARIDAPGALHHIIVRGIERNEIFRDRKDKVNFLDRLGDILLESSTSCYAWTLMYNHVHLFLRTGSVPIATVMRRLLTGYAVSFNRRYNRHGQLFQNRYKSILCQEDPYFLELVRYIHLNPLRAGMVKGYQALENHPFCGHGVIVGKAEKDWMDVNYTLAFFAKRKSTALMKYREFVAKGIEKGSRPDLIGGGLVRSVGGWSEAKKAAKEGGRFKGDERILGDSEFVLKTLKDSEEQFERRYELKSRGYNLDALSERVAEIFNMTPEAIFSPGKYKKNVQVRSVYFYWAVRKLGETATSLAKRFGISQPAVSVSVLRGEKIVKDMNLKLTDN